MVARLAADYCPALFSTAAIEVARSVFGDRDDRSLHDVASAAWAALDRAQTDLDEERSGERPQGR